MSSLPRAAIACRHCRRAFTLVELLIVVVILGILASLVIPQFSDHTRGAKAQAFASNLRDFAQMASVYHQQYNALPLGQTGGDPVPAVILDAVGRKDFPLHTPLGGYWHVGQLDGGRWGVGVWWAADESNTNIQDDCKNVDAQIDDGLLTGGQFVCDEATNRYYWLLD